MAPKFNNDFLSMQCEGKELKKSRRIVASGGYLTRSLIAKNKQRCKH